MKTVVCIVIYDRLKNLERWIEIWNQCNTKDSELRVIHNFYSESEQHAFKQLCAKNKITYIPRKNVGMDIGVFQDVAKKRLPAFNNDFDNLIWVTDDVFPMRKDFVKYYVGILNQYNVGVVCMEKSLEVKPHIRTSGFAIKKDALNKLQFHTDIKTKEDCWQFEHKNNNAFLEQIIKMNLAVIQPELVESSVFWDSHMRKSRLEENLKEFPTLKKNKVIVVCPAYNRYPVIISSMIAQTYQDWELHLIHLGKNDYIRNLVEAHNDERIIYTEDTNCLPGQWAHPIRQKYLQLMKENQIGLDSDYVLITNEDNYYVPTFFEMMLKPFSDVGVIATYCSDMIHSYKAHEVINVKLEVGYIDCGGVVIRKAHAANVGWNDLSHSSDWIYFENIMSAYGKDKWFKVNGCLFVHN